MLIRKVLIIVELCAAISIVASHEGKVGVSVLDSIVLDQNNFLQLLAVVKNLSSADHHSKHIHRI